MTKPRDPMTRSPAVLLFALFVALAPSAGCQLDTNGQQGPLPGLFVDASSSSSSSTGCELDCAQGSSCELRSQGPVCVPFTVPARDAGSPVVPPADDPPVTKPPVADPPVTEPPVTKPPVACNLACVLGSHCVVKAQGPACVPDAIVDAGAPPAGACTLLCVVGRHCKLTAQGPSCVLDEPVLDAGGATQCGSNSCAADEKCCSQSCGVCAPKGSACPDITCSPVDAGAPKQTCASASCPSGTYCDDITGSVECKPLPSCNTFKCAASTTCELVPVQCIRAPCPPQPQCVPKNPQLCEPACKPGARCVVTGNGAKCEPEAGGMSCGKKTCGVGQTCCNASCGTCVNAGGACIQVACLETE